MTRPDPRRLAVVIVSANSAAWLRPCLTTLYERAGDIDLDVVVVAAGCTDGTEDLVHAEFPRARTVSCENYGFAYANNRGLETITAEWVLLLNPDTEILDGTMAALVAAAEAHPDVAVFGVRHVTADGVTYPTIRHFPSVARWLFESLGSERLPFRASWLGERELDSAAYERVTACDWTTGAFMLMRAGALWQVGPMDERFFLYCEETDLCLRMKQQGWGVLHLPAMTILHHANKAGANRALDAQAAFAKLLYADKHFSRRRAFAARVALGLGYGMRSIVGRADRRRSARAALAVVVGRERPDFATATGSTSS